MSFDDVVGYRGKKDEWESGVNLKGFERAAEEETKAGSDLVRRGRGSRVSLGDPELDWGSTIGQRPNNRTVKVLQQTILKLCTWVLREVDAY
jgi:hypothetical protein